MTDPGVPAHGIHMFTQTLTRRARRSPPAGAADRTPRRRPLHRASRPDLDAGRGPRQGRRRAAPDAAQRHADPGTESRVHRIPGRPAHQPHRRDRRPSPHPVLLARQAHRVRRQIELTIGRHDGGVVSTYLCDHAHAGHGGRPRLGRRRLRASRDPAAPHPVRLRRQRHHAGDVDAADPAGRRLRRRDRLRPLRPQRRRRPATPTSSRP